MRSEGVNYAEASRIKKASLTKELRIEEKPLLVMVFSIIGRGWGGSARCTRALNLLHFSGHAVKVYCSVQIIKYNG